MGENRISLCYGGSTLEVDIPASNIEVIEPLYVPGLPDEAGGVKAAMQNPVDSPPLRDLISSRHKVAIVIPDITRPFPGERILPLIVEEIGHVPNEQVTIVIGTGSHRTSTQEEMASLVGESVASSYRVISHNAFDPSTLAEAGTVSAGRPIYMNRDYVEADKRIAVGIVEPHFMAGFSGGFKAVCPGIVGIDDILFLHRAELIGHPRSTWGVVEGNPTQALLSECGRLLPIDFCVNITVNRDQQITRVFAGDLESAYSQACEFSRENTFRPVSHSFDIVVTTGGGYPLDQNLYQAVKGMSAARKIVAEGGLIVCAAECREGFPDHGNFRKLLFEHKSADALLRTILSPGFSVLDQWEAQLLAMISCFARVALYSGLDPEGVRRAHMEPISDISERVRLELERAGEEARVAVIPEGPYTIPNLIA